MTKVKTIEECKVSKKNIYVMLILCILPIILCVIFNVSLVYAFIVGVLSSVFISLRSGYSKAEVKTMIHKGAFECKDLYFVILLIGANVSVWLASGVVPSLIYYGLEYLSSMNFLFAAFILIAVTSVFMGTALGTISTIGIAILGIGKGMGIPTNILVGVIVSGAFIADKISPLSGLVNFNLTSTGITYKEAIKSYSYTLIPTIVITSLIYFYIGSKIPMAQGSKEAMEIINTIKDTFMISPLLLLLPVLTIALSIMGFKSVYCMLTGVMAGSLISVFTQETQFLDLIKYIVFGYNVDTTSVLVNNILLGGGILQMLTVVFIVMGALAISSILQETGIINYLAKNLVDKIKTKKDLIWKTSIISSLLTVLTCDQAAGIIIPAQLLKTKYKELGLENNMISRTVSDTGVIIAPLIPWSANSLIISLVTGVSCIAYAPYAVLCFVAPIITIILSWSKADL